MAKYDNLREYGFSEIMIANIIAEFEETTNYAQLNDYVEGPLAEDDQKRFDNMMDKATILAFEALSLTHMEEHGHAFWDAMQDIRNDLCSVEETWPRIYQDPQPF